MKLSTASFNALCYAAGIVVFVGAMVVWPAHARKQYRIRAQLYALMEEVRRVTVALNTYVDATGHLPATLEVAGLPSQPDSQLVASYQIDAGHASLLVTTRELHNLKGRLVFSAKPGPDQHLVWSCASDDIDQDLLPPTCRR